MRDRIVIGASLGGLEALSSLFNTTLADFPAAVMIVLHTAPNSPRFRAQILNQYTSLPVKYAEHGEIVKLSSIYLAPPDYHLVIAPPDRLCLGEGPEEHFVRPAADVLFRSAADVYGPRLIGVVLTGGDEDGTDGLRAVKAAGGVCVVQDPNEATHPGMPMTALLRDHPDYCVTLDEMAALLTRLVQR